MSIVASVILYGDKNIAYIDALYMGVSASTGTGLNSVPVGDLKLYQQITLFVVAVLSHPMILQSLIVWWRIQLYEKKFKAIDKRNAAAAASANSAASAYRSRMAASTGPSPPEPDDTTSIKSHHSNHTQIAFQPPPLKRADTTYLSWQPRLGRNSAFVALTKEQKDELGGVEYKALKLLRTIIYGYYLGFLALAIAVYLPWVLVHVEYHPIFRSEGYSPAWFAIFLGMSSFCNLGLSLSQNSLVYFQQTPYITLWSAFFVFAGDTFLPIFLRLVIYVVHRLSPEHSNTYDSSGFLLDHPRRCFSLLFPSRQTWVLTFVNLGLNVTDLVLYLSLEMSAGNLGDIPANYRAMCGFFQGVATRRAGLNILLISDLHPSMLMLYILMMYVAIYPLAISIRKTNVYEEQTLGLNVVPQRNSKRRRKLLKELIGASPFKSSAEEPPKHTSALSMHLNRQLAHDIWFIAVGVLLIFICESSYVEQGLYDDFMIIFEAVSAYSNTGLSPGYDSYSISLSGHFNVTAKLCILALMLRGRHRSLPYRVDRSITFSMKALESHDKMQEHVATEKAAPRPDGHYGVLHSRNSMQNLRRVRTNVEPTPRDLSKFDRINTMPLGLA